MKKIFIISGLILLLFSGCSDKKEQDVKFYGNIDVRTVSLAFQVSGKIENINFEEGEKVKKGDVIATLDNALYEEYLKQINAQIEVQNAQIQKLEKGYRKEEIEKARATMEQKKVVMENRENTFKRNEKLFTSKLISEENYESVKTAYESAKALYSYAKNSLALLENGYEKEDILSAKAQLSVLESQKNQHQIHLNDTTLYAPSDGLILTRVHEIGSVVNASQIVVEMAKEDRYWVRSYLSEKDLGRIKPGMKALIYTDSNKEKGYHGTVSFISPLAEFTPKSVQTEDLRTDLVYRFRIVLNSYDDMIKQGMPVTIKFPGLKPDSD
ncbi:MAG: HlyD family efflux transporter periplasmic adaptor subunit [Sulfurimonas sp.]